MGGFGVSIDLRLILNEQGAWSPVRGFFSYQVEDPYTIQARFRSGEDDAVEWVFGRDLLTAGLTRETGEGDVKIWPGVVSAGVSPLVFISLASSEGAAVLECPRGPLQAFLDQSFSLVPYGAEEDFIDMDTTIEALLGEL